jgi:hypothetical protein
LSFQRAQNPFGAAKVGCVEVIEKLRNDASEISRCRIDGSAFGGPIRGPKRRSVWDPSSFHLRLGLREKLGGADTQKSRDRLLAPQQNREL